MAGLPVPVPYSWSVADSFTAAIGNGIRDALNFLLNPPVFVGFQATSQSMANSSWIPLALDSTRTDPYAGHSNTVNNSRYVAKVAGWYTVCGVYAPSGNSSGFRAARIQVNGTAVVGGAVYLPANGGVEVGLVTPTQDVYLNVNDYVEIAGWQNAGTLGTALDSDLRTGLWVRWSHA